MSYSTSTPDNSEADKRQDSREVGNEEKGGVDQPAGERVHDQGSPGKSPRADQAPGTVHDLISGKPEHDDGDQNGPKNSPGYGNFKILCSFGLFYKLYN